MNRYVLVDEVYGDQVFGDERSQHSNKDIL